MNFFNNREIAYIVWTTIFFVFLIQKKSFRKSFRIILKTLFSIKIITSIFLMFIYIFSVILVLFHIKLWDFSLLKDTLIWGLFSSIAFMFASADNRGNLFKKLIVSNIKAIIIFEFILNTYTFPLIIELILIPIFVLIAFSEVVLKKDVKSESIFQFFKKVQIILGLIIIIFTVISLIMDMKNFGSFKTLRNFLLAPSLLILAFPFFYFVAIYSAYEQLFLRIEIGLGDNKKLIRYAKRKMFYLFLLNLKKLQLALNQSVYNLISIKEMKDINNMIMVYKENFFKEK